MRHINIYDNHRCIFIHVPKTGSVSVASALGLTKGAWHGNHHITASCLKQQYPKEFEEYMTFGVVRNPFDRVVSAYEYIRQGGIHNEAQELVLEFGANFAGFCRHGLLYMTKHECGTHFWPQTHFLCDEQGSVVVDEVWRYEELHSRWAQSPFGGIKLPHYNLTKRRLPYKDYYAQQVTVEHVIEAYEDDFIHFNYNKECM